MFRVHRPKTNVFRNREHNSRVWLDSLVILSSQNRSPSNLMGSWSEVGLTQLAKTWFAAWMVKCESLINKLPFVTRFTFMSFSGAYHVILLAILAQIG